MSDYSFDIRPLFWFGIILALLVWGAWELIDYVFIDETIRSNKPIIPKIELVIKNNKVDTIYVYQLD